MVHKQESINQIFLTIADNDRVIAGSELIKNNRLSDKTIDSLKNDIVNLTNLNNLSDEEKEEVAFGISMINNLLDRHYNNLLAGKSFINQTTLPVGASRKMPTSPKGRKLPTSR
jgi:hypothetical protein